MKDTNIVEQIRWHSTFNWFLWAAWNTIITSTAPFFVQMLFLFLMSTISILMLFGIKETFKRNTNLSYNLSQHPKYFSFWMNVFMWGKSLSEIRKYTWKEDGKLFFQITAPTIIQEFKPDICLASLILVCSPSKNVCVFATELDYSNTNSNLANFGKHLAYVTQKEIKLRLTKRNREKWERLLVEAAIFS